MLDKKELKILKKELPRGASGLIRKNLIAKGIRPYTITYINMVLNPADSRKNEDIINEAFEVVLEVKKQKALNKIKIQRLLSE